MKEGDGGCGGRVRVMKEGGGGCGRRVMKGKGEWSV